MYGVNLSKKSDIDQIVEEVKSEPIRVGQSYVVATPVEDGKNSIYFGESVIVLDVADGGFSFLLQVVDEYNKRVVTLPAAVALFALSKDE